MEREFQKGKKGHMDNVRQNLHHHFDLFMLATITPPPLETAVMVPPFCLVFSQTPSLVP